MSDTCHFLHQRLAALPRFGGYHLEGIPSNGVYVLFERGEHGHTTERIVRIGTHTGQNNLASRIREHLFTPNKDRSIFRKHVGRCLLSKAGDPFLSQWNLKFAAKRPDTVSVDLCRLQEVEAEVTAYMAENFALAALAFETVAERLDAERRLLSTISQCPNCGPSETWLGRFHPSSPAIRSYGLWNVQGLRGPTLRLREAQELVEKGQQTRK